MSKYDKSPRRSSNVFVNNRNVSRQNDNNTTHLLPPNVPPCPSHENITSRSSTVKVTTRNINRVNDSISNCTSVTLDQVMSL